MKRENSQHILRISTENLFLDGLKKLEISFLTDLLLDCFLSRFHLSVKLKTVDSTFEMKKIDFSLTLQAPDFLDGVAPGGGGGGCFPPPLPVPHHPKSHLKRFLYQTI